MQFSRKVLAASLAVCLSAGAQAESLRDIYELALENDATLKSQQALYLAGLEDEKAARSQLLPQVSARYSFENSDTDTTSPGIIGFDPNGNPIIGNTFDNTDTDTEGYTVSLQQAIFDLPKSPPGPWPGASLHRARSGRRRPDPGGGGVPVPGDRWFRLAA